MSDRSKIGQRFDELRGEHVVYAVHRQDRTFLPSLEHCPLCPTRPGVGPAGSETEIPFPAYEIAVFDNRFPAFEAPLGAAEVVVYTDRHDGSFGTLAPGRAEALMWVWRHRYMELGARDDIDYVLIFENRGVEVGVTLHHPHGQIYGYPFIPPVPALELAANRRLGDCAPCALMRAELDDGRRVLFENDLVVAYVPYAARWAYEAHVSLRRHRASLLDCQPDELRALAAGLQTLARGYDALFDRPFPYVMAVHQAPTASVAGGGGEVEPDSGDGGGSELDSGGGGEVEPDSGGGGDEVEPGRGWGGEPGAGEGHVHVEFYPPLRTAEKLKYLAGSEQGAGTFVSDTLPEESAGAVREAIARAA